MNRVSLKYLVNGLIVAGLIAGLAIFFQITEPKTSSGEETPEPVTAESTLTAAPEVEVHLNAEPTVTLPSGPSPTFAAQMVLAQTVGGIEISARNIRRGNGELKADICIPILDQDDWMINRVVLKYNGQERRDWGGSLIDPYIPAENGKPGRRCDTIIFMIPDQEEISAFAITVESIYAPPREGLMCKRVQELAGSLAQSGIRLTCVEENGFAGYDIAAKPEGMSQEEAQQMVMDAMNRVTPGPWEFTVKLH